MATKTPTRPKQRQSTQKRSWQNLTDRRKLRYIENTLDKAITKALHEGGIESHEDFKAYVESYSERSGKAPITVELCEGGGNDDEIRGYRFYLTNDPSQRTSGKYLIKNLEGVTDKDENYFTPSNIAPTITTSSSCKRVILIEDGCQTYLLGWIASEISKYSSASMDL